MQFGLWESAGVGWRFGDYRLAWHACRRVCKSSGADASAIDGWMIAPTVGYVAAPVEAIPLSDMAKVADRSSSDGRGVKVPIVERWECKRQQWRAEYNWQNAMTQVAKFPVAR